MGRKYSWPLIVLCSVVVISLAWISEDRLWGQKAEAGALSVAAGDSYEFQLELEGLPVEIYSECSGLGSSNEIDEDMSWTDTGFPITQKTPGALQWHNIRLRREGPGSTNIWMWRKALEDGSLSSTIRNGSITMVRPGSLEPLARWEFHNGWAARLVFDGTVEELIIVHEGLDYLGLGESPAPPARRR